MTLQPNQAGTSVIPDCRTANSPETTDAGTFGKEDLRNLFAENKDAGRYLDNLIAHRQITRQAALDLLSKHYGIPFIEYDEMLTIPADILHRPDLDHLTEMLWFPLAVRQREAWVIASNPGDPALATAARESLKVDSLHFLVALPADVRHLIENQRDTNPGFPASAGRTALARLRTWLAEQRTMLARYRTALAKGRTGLAFMRTGLAFISIALVLLRIFGVGLLNVLEVVLLIAGLMMTIDGLKWYLPVRKMTKIRVDPGSAENAFETEILAIDGIKHPRSNEKETKIRDVYAPTEATFGTTILEFIPGKEQMAYRRTPPIAGAEALRLHWNRLTPVMRRRFLANDRTDLAEERTFLANFRTIMARARTGLAFTRTGIAFSGLGIALLRQFPTSAWNIFDFLLIFSGIAMTMEGFYWYIPGRKTTGESADKIKRVSRKISIWDFIFRPFHKRLHLDDLPPTLAIKGSHAPGIWGTTGLALERTLIAERRNVKSRLRTIMARSRTGMSFIRTGSGFFSVGMGLQVYFGSANLLWSLHNITLMLIGMILILDGFYWHLPAEKTKKEFPYCFADMEIMFPDYAQPLSFWKKVVFSHDDL